MGFSAEVAIVTDGDVLVLSLSRPYLSKEAAEDAAIELVAKLDVPTDGTHLRVLELGGDYDVMTVH